MKHLFLLLASLAFCFSATAQTPAATIQGRVTDSINAAPLSYVTVSLREAGQTNFLKSTYTDEKGAFRFSGLGFKTFEVVISYVGYKPEIVKAAPLSAQNPEVTLPAITLKPAARQLKEVEITTQKILVTQDIDKISYDVAADPESKTETVLDMLRKVPMVTVDADDNIQLKGSGSYRVLINGKTSALFVQNPKDVLKSMPASSIQKIEVITNPPARYEAEGVGGIINIVTIKKSPGGYNGSVSAGLRTPSAVNGSAYLTVKTGKFGFSGNVGTNQWQSPQNRSNFIRREFNGRTLTQNGKGENNGTNRYGSAQMSFELDSLNLFTGSVSFYKGKNESENLLQVLSTFQGVPVQQYQRSNQNEGGWNGNDFGLDYQRGFRKSKDQLLTLSYKYSTSGNGNFADFAFVPELNYEAQTGKTDNQSDMREHTAQADYVQPFGKNVWEVGLKSIVRLNNSTYYYALLNPETDLYETDPTQSNDFDYRQDIYAAYTSVSLKKDKWGLKAGARLEETVIDAAFRSSETAAEQDYLNLIPSVAVSRKLKEMQDLKLSYTQRLERPGMWYLNPYVNRIDPLNISYGNPDLEATTSHSFDLSHSAFIKTTSLNSSLFYNFTNNAIQSVTTLRAGDSLSATRVDTSVTTYANIGNQKNLGASINANINLTKKLNLNLNTSVNYVQLTGILNNETITNDGFTAQIFGYAGYKMEKNWRLSANGGYYSRSVGLQGRSGGYFYNSFTVTKTFLKDDKASFNLSVTNPFQKTRRWINEVNGADFYQRQESEFLMRRVGFSLSYKFGKLKGGITKNKRGIRNDDVLQGSGGAGGGGN